MTETQLMELYIEYAKYCAMMDLLDEYGEYLNPEVIDEILTL